MWLPSLVCVAAFGWLTRAEWDALRWPTARAPLRRGRGDRIVMPIPQVRPRACWTPQRWVVSV